MYRGFAVKEGEVGALVAMYHIIEKGAPAGLSPETGKPRTVKYENWFDTKIPLAPTNPSDATKFNDMLKQFDGFLKNVDKTTVTVEKQVGKSPNKLTEIQYPIAPWVNTWISQALVIKNSFSGSRKNWKYGWFNEGAISNTGFPAAKKSTSLQCIWDHIFFRDPDIKKAFTSQKDNWNPADIYLITAEAEKEIDDFCPRLYQEFLSAGEAIKNEPEWMETFVGSVNAELCNLVKAGTLIPISLKAQTTKVTMTGKMNNLNPIPGGKIDQVRGYFTRKPVAYFTLSNRSGKLDFGPTNSMKFHAFTRAGGYTYPYLVEQRMSGPSSNTNKQEIKDVKMKDGGGTKDANAQAGMIPVNKFKKLISKWSHSTGGNVESAPDNMYDADIPPVGSALSDSEIQFWANEYDELSKKDFPLGESGVTKADLGETSILGIKYSTLDYFKTVADLDQLEITSFPLSVIGEKDRGLKHGNFSAKLRNKLYNLRFLRALSNAYEKKVDGHPQLCMLLVRMYFLAAKMKISDKDLNGPFVKIS